MNGMDWEESLFVKSNYGTLKMEGPVKLFTTLPPCHEMAVRREAPRNCAVAHA